MVETVVAYAASWAAGQLGASTLVSGIVGSVAASVVSSALAPTQKIEGPRLGDLSVQLSAFGGMKPKMYGAWRTSGNVIYCTDKREVVTRTRRGGKGGPKVQTTTYTYNVDMAVAFGQGEIQAIRKMYSNGKLIYDVSVDATAEQLAANSIGAASWKLYLGTETQLPDPTMEAELGVGNVPAYLGTPYVMFSQLDCPQGQIPQLSFELVATGTVTPYWYLLSEETDEARPAWDLAILGNYAYVVASVGTFPTYRGGPVIKTFNIGDPAAPVYIGSLTLAQEIRGIEIYNGFLYATCTTNLSTDPRVYTLATAGGVPGVLGYGETPGYAAQGPMVMHDGYGYSITTQAGFEGLHILTLATATPVELLHWNPGGDYAASSVRAVGFSGNYMFVSMYNSTAGNWRVVSVNISNPVLPVIVDDACVAQYSSKQFIAEAGVLYALQDTTGSSSFFGVAAYDISDPSDVTFLSKTGSTGTSGRSNFAKSGDYVFIRDPAQQNAFDVSDPAAVVYKFGLLVGGSGGSHGTAGKVSDDGLFWMTDGVNGLQAWLFEPDQIVADEASIVDVITDICVRSGVPVDRIQVNASDLVPGYALTQVASGRANLEPLLQSFFISATESGGILKFDSRADKTVVATIPYTELGATDGSGDDNVFPLMRTQETDVPRSVVVNYVNPEADYQPGAEPSRRIQTASVYDVVVALPVALHPASAARVPNVMIQDALLARNRRGAQFTRRYAALDANDMLTVEYPEGSYTNVMIERITDNGNWLEVELVGANPALFNPTSVSATQPIRQTVLPRVSVTQFAVLDIPILRDADSEAGVYVPMAGYSDNWRGAVLYFGVDDANLAEEATVSAGTIFGTTTTVLPDWAEGGVDQINVLRVNLTHGELEAVTHAALLGNGVNVALVGDEILSFMTPTLVSGNTYDLTGLLRKQRGTSGATHAIGERFVLLQLDGLVRVELDTADINVPYSYRAVSVGRDFDSQPSVVYASTARGLRPVSPVGLRRSTTTGNDITLTADRRSRSSVTFPANGVEIPLFEVTEAYETDIYSDNTFTAVLRTIATSTLSIEYTSAQQTADGLTPGGLVSARIYQLSSIVGRGDYLEGTI